MAQKKQQKLTKKEISKIVDDSFGFGEIEQKMKEIKQLQEKALEKSPKTKKAIQFCSSIKDPVLREKCVKQNLRTKITKSKKERVNSILRNNGMKEWRKIEEL
jgi:predicted transcriptional regulator